MVESIPVVPHNTASAPTDAFPAAVAHHFHRASGGTPTRRYYRIGDERICLACANPLVAEFITPALAHLEQAAVPDPALTIHLWDYQSTGVRLPRSPLSPADFGPRREVRWRKHDGVALYYDVWSGVFSMLDEPRRQGFWWAHDVATLAEYARAEPLRTLLHRWYARPGSQFIHTAAVGGPSGAVLIGGASGSGKSTTTLLCLQAGLSILGDDYCLVDINRQPARVYSVYCSAKVDPTGPAWQPAYTALDMRRPDSAMAKAVLLLHPAYQSSLPLHAPIRAILLPEVSPYTPTTLHHSPPAAALRALAPSTLLQLAEAGQTALDVMAQLVQEVPVYKLLLGKDTERIPQVIRELLEGSAP